MKRLAATLAAFAMVGTSAVAVAQPASAAKKYTACVKKKTGEVRIVTGKKKCKKGWKKRSWTKAGPTGSKGADGPSGSANTLGLVVDADGAVVGQAFGTFPAPITIFPVLRDGGLYIYYPNGWLVPLSATPYYDNAACTGVPFLTVTTSLERDAILQDSTTRVVYRPLSEVSVGPASAYKPDGTSTSVLNQARWELDDDGVCQAEVTFTGYRLPLVSVAAPPDFKGPLRLT